MQQDFKFESLSNTLSICISKDHKFGTDAFLLSDFANVKCKDTVCDLGTGCGIIPLLWFRGMLTPPKKIFAVDIQEKAISQLQISIEKNNLQEQIIPINADLKEIKTKITPYSCDIITCNPPYKLLGHGIISELTSEKIARHELLCTIDDVCVAAKTLLKFGGKLCICQRPERLLDVLESMRKHNIEPKRVRFVSHKQDTAPWLFLVEGKKDAKSFLKIEPPLILEEADGSHSQEILRIYNRL
ncbi:MAG: methyltransferase [Oscillospiraceae bacterium]